MELLFMLIELFMELLFLLSSRRLVDIFQRPLVVASICGVVAGLVSLLLFQYPFVESKILQLSSIVIYPALIGAIVYTLGMLYQKLGYKYSSLDTFWAGYCFGLTITVVRVIGTNL